MFNSIHTSPAIPLFFFIVACIHRFLRYNTSWYWLLNIKTCILRIWISAFKDGLLTKLILIRKTMTCVSEKTVLLLLKCNIQGGARNVIPFYHPIKIVTSLYRCCKRASECCISWKMRQMSPVCKMADNGRLAVDQKVKVVLFYAET